MKRNWKQTAGFTLVELIVVIAILGILTAVAVPVYSGYVKKANLAADQTLVESINTAFAAACIENQKDISNLDFTPALEIGEDGVLNVEASTLGGMNEDFSSYLGGEVKFKVVKDNEITFSDTTHMFEIDLEKVIVTIGGINISVSKQLAADLGAEHTFQTLGADGLLGKVGTVSTIAESLLGLSLTQEGGNYLGALVMSDDYQANLKKLLNLEGAENEAAYQALFMDPETEEPKLDALANSLVLTAAQNTQGMDTSFLGTANSAATLRAELESEDPAVATTAMAKLALTYGMYTSYVRHSGKTDNSEAILNGNALTGMTAVLGEIENEDFRTYLNGDQGKKDLAAYMASMEIINNSTKESPETAQSILQSGFNNDELQTALDQLMKG